MGGMTNQAEHLAVAVAGLRKSFGDKMVLDGIDLTIPAGSVFALLGPNGAGNPVTELRRSFLRWGATAVRGGQPGGRRVLALAVDALRVLAERGREPGR
jgi:ABC-type glutathione transport system ATPase component